MAILRRGNSPNGDVECTWGRQKSWFWAYIWLNCLLLTLQQAGVVNTVAGGPRPPSRKLWHIASSKRRCWLREKTTKCLWQGYAKYNRTAHLTACINKSVAYVTNNKSLYSTFCRPTVEANYWQTRSIARPLCDSRATCRHCCWLYHSHNTCTVLSRPIQDYILV